MTADPYKYFRPEARDLVDQFARSVLDLEKGDNSVAAVQRLLRVAHTLKGAARVVKQSEIANRAHAIEDALSPFRDTAQKMAREQIEALLEHLDDISGRLGALAPAETEGRDARRKASAEVGGRTVRADIAETDAVLEGAAETHALLNGLRNTARALEQARHLTDLLVAQLAAGGATDGPRHPGGTAKRRIATAEELSRKLGSSERDLSSTIDQMDRELSQLREAGERLRLVAAGTFFTALERTARDAARALEKEVVFEGKGGDIRLDANVLETAQSALIQLVRNAVAHGIEPEGERVAVGKPPIGRVSVHVSRRGRQIVFACCDDGRGVDLEAVQEVASERGLLDRNTAKLDAQELMRMLLRGGISTSTTLTDISGRGVGLDVVREAIEQLGGDIVFTTARGAGTTIELVIPPSLASMDALLMESEGADGSISAVSIPLDAVRSSLRIGSNDISHGSPGAAILYEHKAIPFVPLATVLDGTPWPAERSWTAIVVAGNNGLAAVGVDRLLGTRRVVARPLPDHLEANPIVAGASLDSNGNPQLVLDPDALVTTAQRCTPSRVAAEASQLPILVVDDSLTTRMLEQSILESAGYDVIVAASAEEGLEMLRRKRCALILVDVEMPGMDGFAFIEEIRSDPSLHEIPAILVTSRASPEDLKRGRDVGAHGHIDKSEFDQAGLLATIKQLMK